MSEYKYTPGPWEASGNGVHKFQSKHYGACVAVTHGDQRHANAKLIAAAPDLLDACKAAAEWIDHRGNPIWRQLIAAITKAELREPIENG